MGDFNLVMDHNIDCKGTSTTNDNNSKEILQAYLKNSMMINIWRHMNPGVFHLMWHKMTPPLVSMIDFILISVEMIGKVQNCDIKPGIKSNHSVVNICPKI